ncbi:MAG TPA: DUF5666 domain-containing protein [Thermoanaerobaculia bacterium]
MTGTVVDMEEGRNRLQLEPDGDRHERVTVEGDTVTTTYRGFGGTINGKPEIFTGSSGFSNIRLGDRLEVRGLGRTAAVVTAEQVTLLGRTVEAPQVGVGGTREQTSVSTPTTQSTTPRYGSVDGVVRQVNASAGTIVVETDRREILNIRAASGTPVYYRNETYQVASLEPGDRIRVEVDQSTTTSSREVRARSIDVIESVQDSGGGTTRRVASLVGRVTRVTSSANTVTLDTGREQVAVDLTNAYDPTDRRIRAADIRVGDSLEISGNYNTNNTAFLATTVRYTASTTPGVPATNDDFVRDELVVVTITGTVAETLDAGPFFVVRDRNGRTTDVWATEDFVVRTKAGTYTTAERLKSGDAVTIRAYRDMDGNYIAQTIRQR